MDDALPFVDEPALGVAADPARTWEALVATLRRSIGGRGRGWGARALACEHVRRVGEFPTLGSQVPGFAVSAVDPPFVLALAGRHRTSAYSLTFRISEAGAGRSEIRAETRAVFPGLVGTLYRAAVIGSGMHARLMASMLADVKRRAQSPHDAR